LGIAGSKYLVKKIRNRILAFTKSYLRLNLTGGEISHIRAGKVKFLGVWISAGLHSKFSQRFGKVLEKKKKLRRDFYYKKRLKKVV